MASDSAIGAETFTDHPMPYHAAGFTAWRSCRRGWAGRADLGGRFALASPSPTSSPAGASLVSSGRRSGRDETQPPPSEVRLDLPPRPFGAVLDRYWDRRMIPSRLSPDLHPRPFCFVGIRVHDGVPVRGSLASAGLCGAARREGFGDSRSATRTVSEDSGTGRPSLNARPMRASNPGLLFLPDRRVSDIKVRMNFTDDGPQLPISRQAAGSFGYRFSASNSPIPVRARLVCQSVRWMSMQSYDQFRESERLTWPVRGGVTALALGAAAFLAIGELPVAAIAAVSAVYAAYLLVVRLVVLDRCRSDKWVYGMMAAETALAASAVAIFGLVSPVIVLPLLLAPHYAHLLGRRGAYAAALAGLMSLSAAFPFHPLPAPGLIAALAISPAMLAGIAAFTSEERFRERRAKEQALDWHASESGSGRLLEAVLKMSSKRGDADVSQALAEGLRIATGYPTAVTLLNRHHDIPSCQ